MKVHQIICPKCKSSLTSKAGIEEGSAINCPKCKSKFAVAPPPEEDVAEDFDIVDDEEEEEEAPKKPAAKSALKPLSKKPKLEERNKADDDEDEDEKPAKKSAKSTLKPLSKKKKDDDEDEDEDKPVSKKKGRAADEDDEDDSPRSKRKRDDDDDDEKPRRRKKKKGGDDDEPQSAYGKLKSNVYVRVGVLGALLIILGVVAYMYINKDKNKDKSDDSAQKKDEEDFSKPDPRYVTKPKTAAEIELAKFQGSWRATKATIGGVDAPPQQLALIVFTVTGDQVTLPFSKGLSRFKVDPTKSPKEVDTIDPTSNKVEKGIYQFVNNDTLEMCSAMTGDRPTEFASPPMSAIGHMTLTRMKTPPNPKDKVSPKTGSDIVRFTEGISIAKPSDWPRVAMQPGTIARFHGPISGPQLSLEIVAEPYDDTPLEQIGEAWKTSFAAENPSFKFEQDGTVPVVGQQAYFMVYSINETKKGMEAQVNKMRYFLIGKNKKNAFILTFTANATEFNANRKKFEEIAASVQTE